MATVAPGGSGGPPDDRDDPNIPADAPAGESDDDFSDEDVVGGVPTRIQCPVCLRFVAKSTGLRRHRRKCVGPRGYTGNFPCIMNGCGRSYLHYGDLQRHFRHKHGGQRMPEVMRNYRRYVPFISS